MRINSKLASTCFLALRCEHELAYVPPPAAAEEVSTLSTLAFRCASPVAYLNQLGVLQHMNDKRAPVITAEIYDPPLSLWQPTDRSKIDRLGHALSPAESKERLNERKANGVHGSHLQILTLGD